MRWHASYRAAGTCDHACAYESIKSIRVEGAYHLLRFRLRDLGEEIVKLDANLPNRDAFGEAIFQYFVLEALNINFQQIDGIVPICLHLTGKGSAR